MRYFDTNVAESADAFASGSLAQPTVIFSGGIFSMPLLFARSSRLSFHQSFPFDVFNLSFVDMRNLDWASRNPAVHLSLAALK